MLSSSYVVWAIGLFIGCSPAWSTYCCSYPGGFKPGDIFISDPDTEAIVMLRPSTGVGVQVGADWWPSGLAIDNLGHFFINSGYGLTRFDYVTGEQGAYLTYWTNHRAKAVTFDPISGHIFAQVGAIHFPCFSCIVPPDAGTSVTIDELDIDLNILATDVPVRPDAPWLNPLEAPYGDGKLVADNVLRVIKLLNADGSVRFQIPYSNLSTAIGPFGFAGGIAGIPPAPPTTTAVASPGSNANGWNNGNVTINLSATDNPGGSLVKQIQFALGGPQNTGWQTVAGNAASVTISAEGTTILSYFATDYAGNQETAKTLSVRIDKTPPVVAATTAPVPNANGWNKTNVTVSFTGTDNLSGIDSCTAPVTLTTEGAGQSVSGTCTDKAGNVGAPAMAKVSIDKTPPIISGMPPVGCSLWPPNGKMVQVATVSAADALSGLAPGSFQVTGTSNEPPSAPEISITPSGSGGYVVQLQAARLGNGSGRVYTLTATASDLAGNSSTVTATCTVPHAQGSL